MRKKKSKTDNCPWKQWGNSVLAVNIFHWKCSYCDSEIGDGIPFQVTRFHSMPYIWDKEFCMVMHLQKLDAAQSGQSKDD